MSDTTTHNIVVIGASFGGLPVAHQLLKDVLPRAKAGKAYKVILINPTREFFWKIGAPRVVANPSSLGLDKTLLEFLPTFEKYGDKFEFIQAYATGIEPTTKTVSLSTSSSVHYDSLVIASGTYFKSDLWSTSPGIDKLKAALKTVHDRLPTAQAILIAGGGAAGIETAGEFGEVYGTKKEITLLSGSTGLLPRLQRKDIGKDAQNKLEKMGVKVMHDNIRVQDIKEEGEKYVLTLTNGEVKTVDIYVDCTGDQPNSSFVPAEWLDDKKKIKTDGQTLRLNVPGVTGVYVIGAVASYSDGGIMDTKMAYKPLCHTIELDLQGTEPGPRTKNVYKKFESDMQFVPVGSTQGVGTAFGWKVPSFVVKMAKSKDYMIGNAPKLIEGNA